MKKCLLSIAILFSVIVSFAQIETSKQEYKSSSLPLLVNNAKTIAILPFKATVTYKRMPKGITVENLQEEEKKLSTSMQEGMLTYLLRKSKNYTVEFQDVDRTNALLKKAGIYNDIDAVLPDSVCKILGVDGIIKSTWAYEKTGSEAGAIVMALAIGVNKGVGSGALTLKLFGASDGELAWRFYKEMNESAFSSASELMERMMRKVGRNFPFEK
jgi:hypothetical protein